MARGFDCLSYTISFFGLNRYALQNFFQNFFQAPQTALNGDPHDFLMDAFCPGNILFGHAENEMGVNMNTLAAIHLDISNGFLTAALSSMSDFGDTVENRVREVLEEKLSVIFKELGVDKYSDVLDSEVAELDFTEVYMNSIGRPSSVERNMYPVESEVKQQVANAQKYKDIIREEKDLTQLVGTESSFDVDFALRQMLAYYESWKGRDLHLDDRISINDEEITQHLRTEIMQDRTSPLMSVSIENFPNEAGYFMLWELSISEEESGKRIIPIFVNEKFLLRPMAGKRIMDVFLDGTSRLTVGSSPNVSEEEYQQLEKLSMDFAYDTFVELKEKQIQLNQESYNKYMYALKLREDAAGHIGIENIRRSRLEKLAREKASIEAKYEKGSQIYPDFRLMILVRLEA